MELCAGQLFTISLTHIFDRKLTWRKSKMNKLIAYGAMLLAIASPTKAALASECSAATRRCKVEGPQFSGEPAEEYCKVYRDDRINPTSKLFRSQHSKSKSQGPYRIAILDDTGELPFRLVLYDNNADGFGAMDDLQLEFAHDNINYSFHIQVMPTLEQLANEDFNLETTVGGQYSFFLYWGDGKRQLWHVDRTTITTRFAEKMYGGADNLITKVFDWDCKEPFPIDSSDIRTLIQKYILPQTKEKP